MPTSSGVLEAPVIVSTPEKQEDQPLFLPPSHEMARLRGVVRLVDLSEGRVEVDVGLRRVWLSAEPATLVWVPGSTVEIEARRYGVRWWLPEDSSVSSFVAVERDLIGTAGQIDKSAGLLVVDGRTLRAHPERLRGVLPGLRLRLRVQSLGAHEWVREAELASASRGELD